MIMYKKPSILKEIYPCFHIDTHKSKFLFLDAVTTGLYWRSSHLESLGIIYHADGKWNKITWSGDSEETEFEILSDFVDTVSDYTLCITYNGDHFDLPYLTAKLKAYGLKDPFIHMASLDLYKVLRPYRQILKLPSMKLADLASWLNLPEMDDTERLFAVSSMQSYAAAFTGHYALEAAVKSEDELLFTLSLDRPLPKIFSYLREPFYMTGEGSLLKIKVPIRNGQALRFFLNYKDYYYLPAEDTAIHKSVAAYVDKAFRQKATPETCYIKFPVTESYMADTAALTQYVQDVLLYMLA